MAATGFARRVLHVLGRLPHGRVVTYGDLARLAGRPGAARAVGRIMAGATRPGLPYHRVIAAGGRLGGYGGHPLLKRALLAADGIPVRGNRVADFRRRRWPDVGGGRERPRRRGARGTGTASMIGSS